MILLILTYAGGVLTILSPCILPVLPFVFARSNSESFAKTSLPILIGMSLTFSLFSAVAILGGEWVGQANEYGRTLAMVFLSLFGFSLIFPQLAEKALAPITRLGSKIGSPRQPNRNPSVLGSFLVGVSTGLLWAPCAGPILGLVLTGAATQGSAGRSVALLLSYSLGAATSLAVAVFAGKKFFNRLKKFLGVDQVIKKILGVSVLLGVVAIAFNLDRNVLVQLSKVETTSIENRLLALVEPPKSPKPEPAMMAKNNSMMMMSGKSNPQETVEGILPELDGITSWIHSKPLTREALLGKVVLIDFWTYSCINCLRTLPYVKAWAEKYQDDGFVVIGVHAPEFAFERNEANVKNAVKDLGIHYPVALDNQYKVWNAFQNRFWPAHYFIDRQGRIRHHHFGEGGYEESETTIRKLIAENGGSIHAKETRVDANGIQAAGALAEVKSPETYIGYDRAENLVASLSLEKDRVVDYSSTETLKQNEWSIQGKWIVSKERATLMGAKGKITFRFHARDLHLVLGGPKGTKYKVRIDGLPPGNDHGVDIDSEGNGKVNEQRLYQLIRQNEKDPIIDHHFEIEFLGPGVEAYAFTFG